MLNKLKIYSLIKCNYINKINGMHSHPFYQLVYVLKGEGGIICENKEYPLKKNDIFLIKRQSPHSLRGKNMLTFEFKFNIGEDKYKNFLDKSEGIIVDKDNRIKRMIERIEREISNKDDFYIEIIKAEFFKLILNYIKLLNKKTLSPEDLLSEDNLNKGFLAVTDYIENNYMKDITIKKLSEISKTGVSSFNKKFKDTYGIPPIQYVNMVRIAKAKEYIINTDLTMSEIADKSGFSSLHYFSRYFKSVTGSSPREFKRKAVNQYIINIDLLI